MRRKEGEKRVEEEEEMRSSVEGRVIFSTVTHKAQLFLLFCESSEKEKLLEQRERARE